jgi:hypothetical protein
MGSPSDDTRRGVGRPREISRPYRLNLYIEEEAAAGLGRIARDVAQEIGRPVSLARALSVSVAESPRLRAPRRASSGPALTLSHAIREGSRIHGSATRPVFFEYDSRDRQTVTASSALGAAWVGLGLKPRDLLTVRLHRHFPVLGDRLGRCPADPACGDWRTLEVQITHLEDRHGWSRARVASWLKRRGF